MGRKLIPIFRSDRNIKTTLMYLIECIWNETTHLTYSIIYYILYIIYYTYMWYIIYYIIFYIYHIIYIYIIHIYFFFWVPTFHQVFVKANHEIRKSIVQHTKYKNLKKLPKPTFTMIKINSVKWRWVFQHFFRWGISVVTFNFNKRTFECKMFCASYATRQCYIC